MSELLVEDPRTAWAWAEHLQTSRPKIVSDELARLLLEAIPNGDHVEVFAEGKILRGKKADLDDSDSGKKGHLVARTMRRWILVREDRESAELLDTPSEGFMTTAAAFESKRHIWCTFYKKAKVKLFVDDYESEVVDRLRDGAAYEIQSLPSWGEVPEPPKIDSLAEAPARENEPAILKLTSDWRVAEEIALEHMKKLGFGNSRLSGGGKDKGVDVVHPQAVAQVKMQGVPVGAPVVQQLRGARPELEHHLFFSTSGYTAAAEQEAMENGVALFRIDAVGRVTALGSAARGLELQAKKRRAGPEGIVANYVEEVTSRVRKATLVDEPEGETAGRALQYLDSARTKLRTAPQIGESPLATLVDYYHHIDCLAAVFYRELGV